MSRPIRVSAEVRARLDAFRLPAQLAFGRHLLPIMARAVHESGRWRNVEIIPYAPLSIDPAARVLHYAQEIFEGLKAYAVDGAAPSLFRPRDNWVRMNASARRLCMPELDEGVFMGAIEAVVALGRSHIPLARGASLYLRPFMIGVEASLNLGPSARHEFYVIASPSEALQKGAFHLFVEQEHSRAAVGGTGAVKAGANYAGAEASSGRAEAAGCNQTLWLDPVERRYVEELSGMNLFAVIDGALVTPPLSGTLLPGVTRDSVLRLAAHLGHSAREQPLEIHELCGRIAAGTCREIFASGTAATLVPVASVRLGERLFHLAEAHPVTDRLRLALLALQEGRGDDPFGWRYPVTDVPLDVRD